jgi:4-diphosphocytidyl-2-C-methyl-D-erythritol kinase
MTPGTGWQGTAHAKVNLTLRVLAREESGYHQLETVFQALELGDRVEVELRAEPGIVLEVTGVGVGSLGPDEDNLAVRAARAFLDAVGSGNEAGNADEAGVGSPGMAIRLEKRIPHGAGLGGGSSDAGAVLRGLNEVHGAPLGLDDLLRIGGKLGADVPFFLSGASRALAWNRGDRLLPLPASPSREVVVAVPRKGMATPEAYRLLAEHRERSRAEAAPAVLLPAEGPGFGSGVNDFEAAILPLRPDIRELRDSLAGAGAELALMAGSGSAVFGLFGDGSVADGAEGEVRAAFPEVRVIRTRSLE